MKFAFIACRDLNEIGGIENYTKNLSFCLAKKNHEVVIYSDTKCSFINPEIKVVAFNTPKNKFLKKIILGLLGTLHAVVIEKNIKIIHYHAFAAALFSFLPILLAKKVIYQGHGFEWKREKWSTIQRQVIKFLDFLVLRINPNILMVSDEQTQFVKSKFKKNCITLTPGINMPSNLDSDLTQEILASYDLKPNQYYLFLGRLVPEKNPHILIEAFKRINNSNFKLVIAGDEKLLKEYKNKLLRSGQKSPNIVFTGAVYGTKKEILLKNCGVFCLPSSLEGLPISLLEAMSYSKICITSNIPACREALKGKGLFHSPNSIEELEKLLIKVSTNFSEYKHLEDYNINRVKENYLWSKICQKYLVYCEESLSSN